MKTKPCPHCFGKGQVIDSSAMGKTLRSYRRKSQVSLRSMAEALGISACYLSDMERGNRSWSLDRIEAFNKHIEKKKLK